MSEAVARRSRVTARAEPRAFTPVPPSTPRRRIERVLRIAADLFDVDGAVLVVASAGGFRVDVAWSRCEVSEAAAIETTHRLAEALARSRPDTPAGVFEEVDRAGGFRAAVAVVAADGAPIGAVCLVDAARRSLLTRLQRRLFGEFGGLIMSAIASEAS